MSRLNRKEYKQLMGHSGTPDTNRNYVNLLIYNFDYHPSHISEKLMIQPHSTGVRGESHEIPYSRIQKTHEYNYWEHEWEICTNDFIGDIIDRYVDEIIRPNISFLQEIAADSDIIFRVIQYYYSGCNPGFRFDKGVVQILSALGASIDIDLYCLSEE